jgi:hypothetical protein
MSLRALAASFALCTSVLLPAGAQTGFHPQSLGFSLGWVHNKDTVFCPVNADKFHRMLQVNPSTKEWRWVNDVDFPGNLSGPMVMKNAKEGVSLVAGGTAPYQTSDGWKTVTKATGAIDGIQQVVATDAGYAGHGNLNRSLSFSADGLTWTAAEGGLTGSGGGALAAFKNKVIVFGGGSFFMLSTDGGKKYAITNYETSAFKNYKEILAFRMFSEDSLLLATNTDLYTSTNGGLKWTAGKAMPATGATRVLVRGWQDLIVSDQLGKLQITSDAGATWTPQAGPQDPANTGLINLVGDDLWFWPGYRSKDMGATWTPMFPNVLNASGSGLVFSMAFSGDFGAVGFATGRIAYTWDRGRSFTMLDTLPSKQDVMALKILKNNRLLAGDRNGQVFISSDTGRTWTNKLTSTFSQNAIKFSVSEDEKTMILTRGGQPAGSGDNGDKWDFLPAAGGGLTQTVKPDGTIIGMVNSEIANLSLTAARTKMDTLANGQDPEDIVAVNDNVGYIVMRVSGFGDQETRVFKTTDGFKTNTLASSLPKSAFTPARMQAVSADVLALVAEGKTYHMVSSDGGKTWSKDSLDVHTKYTAYPSVRRVFWFNASERIYALTGQALYLAAGAGGTGIRADAARRAAETSFSAAYDARSGRVSLRGLGALPADVAVFDVQGRKLLSGRSDAASRWLDVAGIPKGMYFVRARLPSGKVLDARMLKH